MAGVQLQNRRIWRSILSYSGLLSPSLQPVFPSLPSKLREVLSTSDGLSPAPFKTVDIVYIACEEKAGKLSPRCECPIHLVCAGVGIWLSRSVKPKLSLEKFWSGWERQGKNLPHDHQLLQVTGSVPCSMPEGQLDALLWKDRCLSKWSAHLTGLCKEVTVS